MVTLAKETPKSAAAVFFIDKQISSAPFSKGARPKIKPRDRIDIFTEILDIANGGVTNKMRMMCKANTSYEQLRRYMTFLIERDLLCYDLDSHTFRTTEKGLRLLVIYNHIKAIISTT